MQCTGKTALSKFISNEKKDVNLISEVTLKHKQQIRDCLKHGSLLRNEIFDFYNQAEVLIKDALLKATYVKQGINILDRFTDSVVQYMAPNLMRIENITRAKALEKIDDIVKQSYVSLKQRPLHVDYEFLFVCSRRLIHKRLKRRYGYISKRDMDFIMGVQSSYEREKKKSSYMIDATSFDGNICGLANLVNGIIK